AVAYRQLEDFRLLGEKRIDVLTAGDESGADLERLAGTGRYHDPARVTEIGGKVARARHNAIEVAPKGGTARQLVGNGDVVPFRNPATRAHKIAIDAGCARTRIGPTGESAPPLLVSNLEHEIAFGVTVAYGEHRLHAAIAMSVHPPHVFVDACGVDATAPRAAHSANQPVACADKASLRPHVAKARFDHP